MTRIDTLTGRSPETRSFTWWRTLTRREVGVGLLLAATAIAVSAVNPSFLSSANIRDLLVQAAPAAIVACGLTFVVLTGEIDISVGSLMGLLAVALGLLSSPDKANLPVPVAIGLTLLLGLGLGCLNGLLVTWGRVPSIIVTLGMLSGLRGATEWLMGGTWITSLPGSLRYLATGDVFGLRISILTAGVVALVSVVVARRTPWGRRVYAVGSNPEAAHLAGLPVKRIKLMTFALTGLLVAVATVISVPQLRVIESGIGVGFELLVVTCVVVGGTSIRGGRGTLIGTVLGVLLLGMVRTALIFLQLGERAVYWERAIQGGFILLAVLVDHLARRAAGDPGEEP